MKPEWEDFDEEIMWCFDDDNKEIWIEVTGRWLPPRPSPYCRDPDNPRFSDDGDPGEIEITAIDGSEQRWKDLTPSQQSAMEDQVYENLISYT